MRKRRLAKILEIVTENEVETQDELQTLLRENGFDVTQATISRDIKELRIFKDHGSDGRYVYKTVKKVSNNLLKQTGGILNDSVLSVQYAMNTVCIKCFAGMANAVCAAIDSTNWEGVVGTIAGDDTIFVLCRSEQAAKIFTENLEKMLNA